MKIIHIINKIIFIVTCCLYLIIYLGLLSQILLGVTQVIMAICCLADRCGYSSKFQEKLKTYCLLVVCYFIGCFCFYILDINAPKIIGVIGLMIIPMSLAAYFLHITYLLEKECLELEAEESQLEA